MGNGIIAQTFQWVFHPTFDTDTSTKDWLLGLLVVICVAFLWSRVLREIIGEI